VPAAPIIAASGERRSCETDDSSALRRRACRARPRQLASDPVRPDVLVGQGEGHHPGRRSHRVHRQQPHADAGETGLVPPGRARVRSDPARCGELVRPRLGCFRGRGDHGQRAAGVRREQHGAAGKRARQRHHRGIAHCLLVAAASQLLAQVQQRTCTPLRLMQGFELVGQPRCQPAADQRDGQEQTHRQHVVRLFDRQRVARLGEEEVVADETQQRGIDRHRHARAHRHHQHGGEKHQRQVRYRQITLRQKSQRETCQGHRACEQVIPQLAPGRRRLRTGNIGHAVGPQGTGPR